MAVLHGLERQVANALLRAGYSGGDHTLVVAVSGGPDSSALVHSLYRLKDEHHLRLHVAHLNHNFRGEEAYADARFVSALAQDLELDATVEERDVLTYQRARHISSFEQAAREIRYAFLAEVAERTGAVAVTTGHTADDVAETVLLHILRGAGIHGLRGMTELSPWPWYGRQLRLFRPLLRVTKADTLSYCDALGQQYRNDSGNYMPRFTRNRLRHDLLPQLASEYNPKVRESLVRLARTAALELDYMEGEISRLWPQVAAERDGAVVFDRSALTSLHPALQVLLLRKAYAFVTGNTSRLEERHLGDMAELARGKGSDRSLDLPGGLKFHRSRNHLQLSKDVGLPYPFPRLDEEYHLSLPSLGEPEKTSLAGPWRVTLLLIESSGIDLGSNLSAPARDPANSASEHNSWSTYMDPRALGEWLRVRVRLPGDRFQPLGMEGKKKLQDFFTDDKVPKEWRDRVPLMVAQQGIAWVVGYRIAHWARVQPSPISPEPVIKVTFERAT